VELRGFEPDVQALAAALRGRACRAKRHASQASTSPEAAAFKA